MHRKILSFFVAVLFCFFQTTLHAEDEKTLLVQSVTHALEQVVPAIVWIECELPAAEEVSNGWSVLEWIYEKLGSEKLPSRRGVGFFLSSDGYLATAYPLIKGGTKIRVRLSDQTLIEHVLLVGYDEASGLALLKVEGQNFPFLSLETTLPGVEDWVISPGKSAWLGYVLRVPSEPFQSNHISPDMFIQTDFPQPGALGGPLINLEGKVIGIHTVVLEGWNLLDLFSSSYTDLAIPSDSAERILTTLLHTN